ncbi:MAG TPA: hypothetical protein PKM95_14250, partial [Deltaproteobacteria bacterium]|nr:hypothetical protein [Deltaproteobacteria bacterium]
ADRTPEGASGRDHRQAIPSTCGHGGSCSFGVRLFSWISYPVPIVRQGYRDERLQDDPPPVSDRPAHREDVWLRIACPGQIMVLQKQTIVSSPERGYSVKMGRAKEGVSVR